MNTTLPLIIIRNLETNPGSFQMTDMSLLFPIIFGYRFNQRVEGETEEMEEYRTCSNAFKNKLL